MAWDDQPSPWREHRAYPQHGGTWLLQRDCVWYSPQHSQLRGNVARTGLWSSTSPAQQTLLHWWRVDVLLVSDARHATLPGVRSIVRYPDGQRC
jgi:hypothetical protein